MANENLTFLAKEYTSLWKEFGVEGTLLDGLTGQPKQRTTRKLPPQTKIDQAKPVPVSQPNLKSETPQVVEPRESGTLEAIRTLIGDCTRCKLCEGRTNIVFGTGSPTAKLMFVGEGPGADEDQQALPFVGQAGKLLDKIIEAMNYKRSDVYIANVVKCRPPNNRAPEADEVAQCLPFLMSQIDLIQPQIIVALGGSAAAVLLGSTTAISNLRGRFHPFPRNQKMAVMPTFHPAYLLRNPAAKRLVWDDMKLVKATMESKT